MTGHLPAGEATAAVRREWCRYTTGRDWRPEVRRCYPSLGRAIGGLVIRTGTALDVADAWGNIEDTDPNFVWLVGAWPALTDTLDELLFSTVFDHEGF